MDSFNQGFSCYQHQAPFDCLKSLILSDSFADLAGDLRVFCEFDCDLKMSNHSLKQLYIQLHHTIDRLLVCVRKRVHDELHDVN